jgi:hypothetical protein
MCNDQDLAAIKAIVFLAYITVTMSPTDVTVKKEIMDTTDFTVIKALTTSQVSRTSTSQNQAIMDTDQG